MAHPSSFLTPFPAPAPRAPSSLQRSTAAVSSSPPPPPPPPPPPLISFTAALPRRQAAAGALRGGERRLQPVSPLAPASVQWRLLAGLHPHRPTVMEHLRRTEPPLQPRQRVRRQSLSLLHEIATRIERRNAVAAKTGELHSPSPPSAPPGLAIAHSAPPSPLPS